MQIPRWLGMTRELLCFWPDDLDVLDHNRPDRSVGVHIAAALRDPLHQLDAAHVALAEDHVSRPFGNVPPAAVAALVIQARIARRIRLFRDEELAGAAVRAAVGVSEPPGAV